MSFFNDKKIFKIFSWNKQKGKGIVEEEEIVVELPPNFPYDDPHWDEEPLTTPQFAELLGSRMKCLTDLGFKYVKSRKAFDLVDGDRTITVEFSTAYNYVIWVKVLLIIQFKSVKKIFKAVKKDYNFTRELKYLPLCRYTDLTHVLSVDVGCEKEFFKVQDHLQSLMPTILEGINEMRTIQDLDKLYNDPPFIEGPRRGIYNNWPYGCMIGLIAAKLANNPNYDHLVQVYRDFFDSLVQKFKRDGDDEATIRNWKACNTDILEAIIDYFAKK